eukprot:3713957-Alexandrium_andersonii.AAC.1
MRERARAGKSPRAPCKEASVDSSLKHAPEPNRCAMRAASVCMRVLAHACLCVSVSVSASVRM